MAAASDSLFDSMGGFSGSSYLMKTSPRSEMLHASRTSETTDLSCGPPMHAWCGCPSLTAVGIGAISRLFPVQTPTTCFSHSRGIPIPTNSSSSQTGSLIDRAVRTLRIRRTNGEYAPVNSDLTNNAESPVLRSCMAIQCTGRDDG